MTSSVVITQLGNTLRNGCQVTQESLYRVRRFGLMRDIVGGQIELFSGEFDQLRQVRHCWVGNRTLRQI